MNQRSTLRLATGQLLPDLRIVGSAELLVHEESDPVRVDRLITRLRDDGVLRNPPVAAPLARGGFMILDGANRTAALTALGVSSVPLHVVEYEDDRVQLEVWRHFVVGTADLPSRISRNELTLEVMTQRDAEHGLAARTLACYVVARDETIGVRSELARGRALERVVAAYRGISRIYRVQGGSHSELVREYGTDGTLIIFPSFTKTDIVEFARASDKLPTGITRHVIPGRALRLNLPLDTLSTSGDVAEKNRWLGELIRQKLLDNRIRYYPEATFLFDE